MDLCDSYFRSKFDEICRKNRSAGRPFAETLKTRKTCLCRGRAVSLLYVCLCVCLIVFLSFLSLCAMPRKIRKFVIYVFCMSFCLSEYVSVFLSLSCYCQGRAVSFLCLSVCPNMFLFVFLSLCAKEEPYVF